MSGACGLPLAGQRCSTPQPPLAQPCPPIPLLSDAYQLSHPTPELPTLPTCARSSSVVWSSGSAVLAASLRALALASLALFSRFFSRLDSRSSICRGWTAANGDGGCSKSVMARLLASSQTEMVVTWQARNCRLG